MVLSQLPSYRNFKFLVKQGHLFTLGNDKDTERSSNTEQRERNKGIWKLLLPPGLTLAHTKVPDLFLP